MKILLPVATKTINDKILKWVCGIAKKFDADVDVLNVQYSYEAFTLTYPTYPEFVYVADNHDPDHDEKALKTAESVSEAICDIIRGNCSHKVNPIARLGEPADVIIDLADSGDYDLIVLKDRDRSEVGRFFLGSISDKIVHHCKTPVLIIKDN